jgi:hypothetical protein
MIDEVTVVRANVVVRKCDVSNSGSVQNLIANELVENLEIRAVVHGAMVLHVRSL